jgi:amino acid transporter
MELYNVQQNEIRDNSAGVFLSRREVCMERCLRFYERNFHLITIPIGTIVGIIHLIFGIEYLGQCQIQPMINIYLIVQASVTLFIMLLALTGVITVRCIYPRLEKENNKKIARHLIVIIITLASILFLFTYAWLVAGAVWVFGARSNGEQGSDSLATTTYCQPTLYRAAFTLTIINLVINIVIIPIIIMRRMYCRNR